MKKVVSDNLRLGVFVMAGLAFLIAALYLIGSNRNLFNPTFEVTAIFYNVNGLTKGNNVRFSGIDIGTVKRVEIISDTSVKVTMIIENNVRQFIRKNSTASVGTDGLMGNRLVNISNVAVIPGEIIEAGDMLVAIKPVETEKMLRTLDLTNSNLYHISNNLNKITQKVNNSNSLWSLLMDTTLAIELKQSISSVRITTNNAANFTNDLNHMLHDLRTGKGIAGSLLSDSVSAEALRKSIHKLQSASDKAYQVTDGMKQLTDKIKNGEGGVGVLMSDSVFASDLKKSMHNVEIATAHFDQNMEAMKHNFLFRGYFKDKEKALKKAKKDSLAAAGKLKL